MPPSPLQSSFSDIARVLSEFFRDLDVVPTDVIVGLVLLRHRQQLIRMRVVDLVCEQPAIRDLASKEGAI